MESSYNNKIYKYSIRDTTEPLGNGSESSSSGGSGDYSTAHLTINNATDAVITANGPCIDNISLGTPLLAPSTVVQSGETKTLTVLLYKGRCAFGIMPYNTYLELDYTYEGDVYQQTLESVGGRYHIITGDATIIVSGGGR